MGQHLHAFWNDLWPNAIAPSIWTLLAVIGTHVRATRQRREQHEDMKRHVTKQSGGGG